jgi:hypothetical protein
MSTPSVINFVAKHPKATEVTADAAQVTALVLIGAATDGLGDLAALGEAGEAIEGGAAAGDAAVDGSASTEASETTEIVKTRPTPGQDGATSRHIIERADGETRSVTHQVEKDGKIIHQHQTHVGKYGGQRQFPDEWVKHPKVPQ